MCLEYEAVDEGGFLIDATDILYELARFAQYVTNADGFELATIDGGAQQASLLNAFEHGFKSDSLKDFIKNEQGDLVGNVLITVQENNRFSYTSTGATDFQLGVDALTLAQAGVKYTLTFDDFKVTETLESHMNSYSLSGTLTSTFNNEDDAIAASSAIEESNIPNSILDELKATATVQESGSDQEGFTASKADIKVDFKIEEFALLDITSSGSPIIIDGVKAQRDLSKVSGTLIVNLSNANESLNGNFGFSAVDTSTIPDSLDPETIGLKADGFSQASITFIGSTKVSNAQQESLEFKGIATLKESLVSKGAISNNSRVSFDGDFSLKSPSLNSTFSGEANIEGEPLLINGKTITFERENRYREYPTLLELAGRLSHEKDQTSSTANISAVVKADTSTLKINNPEDVKNIRDITETKDSYIGYTGVVSSTVALSGIEEGKAKIIFTRTGLEDATGRAELSYGQRQLDLTLNTDELTGNRDKTKMRISNQDTTIEVVATCIREKDATDNAKQCSGDLEFGGDVYVGDLKVATIEDRDGVVTFKFTDGSTIVPNFAVSF